LRVWCAIIGSPRLRNTEQPIASPMNHWVSICVHPSVPLFGNTTRFSFLTLRKKFSPWVRTKLI